MKAELVRADVSYEAFFKKPLLDRAPATPAPLQTLFDALNEGFSVSITDVQTSQGSTVAQNNVTVSLFGGAGTIELRADRWRGFFQKLISPADVALIKRCLETVAACVEKVSERTKTARTIVSLASWYKCDITADEVGRLLASYWSKDKLLDADFLNARKIEHVLNPKLINNEEGWEATFYVAISAAPESQLFINYSATYVIGGKYNSIEQQASHIDAMLTGMLCKLGFELRTDSQTNA